MAFPLNPTAGQRYVNTHTGRHYVYKECADGSGFWDLDASKMLANAFEEWDAGFGYAPGDIVIHRHGMYEAKQASTGQEPVLWNDSANVLADANWNYIGIVPQVLMTGQVPANGIGLIRYVGNVNPAQGGTFSIAPEPAELDDWSLAKSYYVRDTCTFQHGLYRSLTNGNQANQPTPHASDTNWEFLGYLPDPTNVPIDGQVLTWDGTTNDFVFKTPAMASNIAKVVHAELTTNQRELVIPLPNTATKHVNFKAGGIMRTGTVSPFDLIAATNAGFISWHDMILPNDCDVHLLQEWHSSSQEKHKFQQHSAGNPNGEFAANAVNGVHWGANRAMLHINQVNWIPKINRSWSLTGSIIIGSNHTTMETTFQFIGNSNETFISQLSMFSSVALSEIERIGFGFRDANAQGIQSAVVEFV